MTLKNEIFEGIAAYKALAPTSQDAYYDEKTKAAKRENDIYEEMDRERAKTIKRGKPAAVPGAPDVLQPPVFSSSTTPGTQVDQQGRAVTGVGTGVGNQLGQLRRGGRVQRMRALRTNYRAGGAVRPRPDDDEEDRGDGGLFTPDYRVGEDDPPEVQRGYRPGPHERSQQELRDWPTTDTDEEGGTYQGEGRYEGEPEQPNAPEPRYRWGPNYRSGERIKAFDDGGVASAFRGGRPAYNRDEDPDVIAKNEADEVIRSIISANLGEPNPANDPSIELRERGERDRAKALTIAPPPSDPPLPQSPAMARSEQRRRGQLPTFGPQVSPEDAAASAASYDAPRFGGQPKSRAELEATFQSPVFEARGSAEGEGGSVAADAEAERVSAEDAAARRTGGDDTDDAYLSTGAARQPPAADTDDAYLSTDNAREPPDAERDYRRQFPAPPQDQPISEDERQAIKLRTPVPKTSRYRDWAERGQDEDAANARANQESWRQRERDRKQTRGKASAERQKAEPGLFENLTPEELQKRREQEAAAARVATSTEPPNIVYPQKEEELRALETKPPPPPAAVQPTQNLPVKPGSPTQPGEQYGPPAPTAAQAAAAAAAPAAPAGPRPAGAGDPSVYGPVIQRPAHDPDYTGMNDEKANLRPLHTGRQGGYGPAWEPTGAKPSGSPPIQPPPADKPAGATTTGATTGTNTPGGHPNAATPPAGSGAANQPTHAEKPDTRTAAYNPDIDRVDPQTGLTLPRQLDAQGRAIATGPPIAQGDGGPPGSPATGQITRTSSTQTYGDSGPGSLSSSTGYTNQDIAVTLNGATSLVRRGVNGGPPPIGHLAASRPAFNAYIQHHNQGGKFTPGEAMLAGMVSDYKILLKYGKIDQANKMAYGLLQAANLEAASHGEVARDKFAAGDYGGAKQSLVTGLNYIADGVTQELSPDGQYILSKDPRTGQVMARTPADGRTVLAGIMGLQDGTLFWKTLQASAQMLQKPDRGAEGRQLSNELRRRQIALADKRLNAPPPGRRGGGPTTTGGMNIVQRELARIRGEKPEPPPQQQAAAVDNDGYPTDTAIINTPVVDYVEPGDQ